MALGRVNALGGGSSGTGISASASSGTVSTTVTKQFLFLAGMVASCCFTGAGTGFTSRVITTPDGDIGRGYGGVSARLLRRDGHSRVFRRSAMQVAAFNAAVLSTNPVVNYAPVITVQPTGVMNRTRWSDSRSA